MMSADQQRAHGLLDFYAMLDQLAAAVGGSRTLATCNGHATWPQRGVYFFFEPGETRTHSGSGVRVVRVGTHALNSASQSTLWRRLSQHRGSAKSGGGNHRGSIFRLLVGASLIERMDYQFPTWGQGSSAPPSVRASEVKLEKDVSQIIGAMPFLCLTINDDPNPQSARGFIERNAIALLSNLGKEPIDPPSAEWLGHDCNREKVRLSGLWNSNHVDEACDLRFLSKMAGLVANMAKSQ
jgi:hypothetical protein